MSDFDPAAFWADTEPTRERVKVLECCGLNTDTEILRALAKSIGQLVDDGTYDGIQDNLGRQVKGEAQAIVREIEALAQRVAAWEGPLV